jgi:hypothetical protein
MKVPDGIKRNENEFSETFLKEKSKEKWMSCWPLYS